MNQNIRDAVDGPRIGHLMIVGGHENRESDLVILDHFTALAGGRDANIFVLTAASKVHDEVWGLSEKAFA